MPYAAFPAAFGLDTRGTFKAAFYEEGFSILQQTTDWNGLEQEWEESHLTEKDRFL